MSYLSKSSLGLLSQEHQKLVRKTSDQKLKALDLHEVKKLAADLKAALTEAGGASEGNTETAAGIIFTALRRTRRAERQIRQDRNSGQPRSNDASPAHKRAPKSAATDKNTVASNTDTEQKTDMDQLYRDHAAGKALAVARNIPMVGKPLPRKREKAEQPKKNPADKPAKQKTEKAGKKAGDNNTPEKTAKEAMRAAKKAAREAERAARKATRVAERQAVSEAKKAARVAERAAGKSQKADSPNRRGRQKDIADKDEPTDADSISRGDTAPDASE